MTGVHHVVFSFKSDGGANAQDELYDITTYTFTESQDETPSTPVDKSDLQSAVNENSGLNASDYTEESWKVFADALQKAQAVLQDESATEQQVQDALAALNSARAGLKLADDSTDGNADGSNDNASDAVDDTNRFLCLAWCCDCRLLGSHWCDRSASASRDALVTSW